MRLREKRLGETHKEELSEGVDEDVPDLRLNRGDGKKLHRLGARRAHKRAGRVTTEGRDIIHSLTTSVLPMREKGVCVRSPPRRKAGASGKPREYTSP